MEKMENKEKQKQQKRILYEEQEIDYETGEIVRRKTTLKFSKEPAYVKLYFDCLGVVIKNEGLNESLNDMLLEVLKLGNYADEEQTVILNAYLKEKICKKTGKSLRRLEQAITIWVKNKVLIRVSRGTYRINPWIFGKGEWRDISNLRANFDFKAGNLTVEREYETSKNKPKTNTSESPSSHETPPEQENVSETDETPGNEPNFTEMEEKKEEANNLLLFSEHDRETLPQFKGLPEICNHAANIRTFLWFEFVYKSDFNKMTKANNKMTKTIIAAFYNNKNPEWWNQFQGKTFEEFCESIKR